MAPTDLEACGDFGDGPQDERAMTENKISRYFMKIVFWIGSTERRRDKASIFFHRFYTLLFKKPKIYAAYMRRMVIDVVLVIAVVIAWLNCFLAG